MKEALTPALDRFCREVERGEYFAAHETLEALWFPIRGERERWEAPALKGLINGAVALELARRGRKDAAERVWETYRKYRRERYPEADEAFGRAKETLEKAWVKRPSG